MMTADSSKHTEDEVDLPEEDSKPPAKRSCCQAALKSEELIAEKIMVQEDDNVKKSPAKRRRKNAANENEEPLEAGAEAGAEADLVENDISAPVIINVDAMVNVMEFLPPRSLYKVALTCKSLREKVTTKMVIQSALIHGGNPKRTMEELYALMSNFAIHVPTPLRLLRLANGKRCEFCLQSKCNNVRPGLGVFACWDCVSSGKQGRHNAWISYSGGGAINKKRKTKSRSNSNKLTKAWRTSWKRYQKQPIYRTILSHSRVAPKRSGCGTDHYFWNEHRSDLTGEKIGPIVIWGDVDDLSDYYDKLKAAALVKEAAAAAFCRQQQLLKQRLMENYDERGRQIIREALERKGLKEEVATATASEKDGKGKPYAPHGWACEFCRTAIFPTFAEAALHETTCAERPKTAAGLEADRILSNQKDKLYESTYAAHEEEESALSLSNDEWIDYYLTKNLHAPPKEDYAEFNEIFSNTVQIAARVSREREELKKSKRDDKKQSKVAKVEKMLENLKVLIDERFRDLAIKVYGKESYLNDNTSPTRPCLYLETPFLNSWLGPYIKSPSKMTKKAMKEVAEKINVEFHRLEEVLKLDFLSDDDQFEAATKTLFRESFPDLESLFVKREYMKHNDLISKYQEVMQDDPFHALFDLCRTKRICLSTVLLKMEPSASLAQSSKYLDDSGLKKLAQRAWDQKSVSTYKPNDSSWLTEKFTTGHKYFVGAFTKFENFGTWLEGKVEDDKRSTFLNEILDRSWNVNEFMSEEDFDKIWERFTSYYPFNTYRAHTTT